VLALDEKGNLFGWGSNTYNQISLNPEATVYEIPTPKLIRTHEQFVKIASGDNHCLGLTKEGKLFGWGWNYYGQIIGGSSEIPEPALISEEVRDMAAGWGFTLVLKTDGRLWGCGNNGRGAIGVPERLTGIPELRRIEGLEEVVMFGCGDSFSFAKARGGFYIWGDAKLENFGRCEANLALCVVPEINLLGPGDRLWDDMGRWLFLGKKDENSKFFVLPVEVLFNFVGVLELEPK
jgi:alpha-tubulin suppressor-like RCC1 family protein